jgi:hypothetical protein
MIRRRHTSRTLKRKSASPEKKNINHSLFSTLPSCAKPTSFCLYMPTRHPRLLRGRGFSSR